VGIQAINEIANQYGELKVTERTANRGENAAWLCKCSCGNTIIVVGSNLRNGRTQSCGCKRPNNEKNELDNKYGRLLVIQRAKINKGKGAYWLCKCDCGNEVTVYGGNLRRGTTRSCGCLSRERASETHRLPYGESAFNTLIHRLKRSAKQRGHSWSLTKDQIRQLTSMSCYYCGVKPFQGKTSQLGHNGVYIFNGIDRVNNTRGYTIDNVVPACGICNLAKRTMSQDEFKAWVCRIYEHFGSK